VVTGKMRMLSTDVAWLRPAIPGVLGLGLGLGLGPPEWRTQICSVGLICECDSCRCIDVYMASRLGFSTRPAGILFTV